MKAFINLLLRPSLVVLLSALCLGGCIHKISEASLSDHSEEVLFRETVYYAENHDPAMVWLRDGRRLQVIYGKIRWEQVEAWPLGYPLQLIYSARDGSVLVDPATTNRIAVIEGFGDTHPLDRLLARHLADVLSTQARVEAYTKNSEQWKAEGNRIREVILGTDSVPAELKRALRKSASAWATYLDQHLSAAASIFSLSRGTIWRITLAQHRNRLERDRALLLGELIDPAGSGALEHYHQGISR